MYPAISFLWFVEMLYDAISLNIINMSTSISIYNQFTDGNLRERMLNHPHPLNRLVSCQETIKWKLRPLFH